VNYFKALRIPMKDFNLEDKVYLPYLIIFFNFH